MIRCPNCGKWINCPPCGDNICPYCGYDLEEAKSNAVTYPKRVGFVESAEINEEGKVIARLVITDNNIAQELKAYIDVPLPGYVPSPEEAKRQLILELPGKRVMRRQGKDD